ncbi:hypothetical protein LTR53_013799 [Teratosphaeriaceae sp. CCFEE 6253]|nr:hypothetical protein LTR53_013799 [Teratosphaeriaceae sp. CCFEE 6253]
MGYPQAVFHAKAFGVGSYKYIGEGAHDEGSQLAECGDVGERCATFTSPPVVSTAARGGLAPKRSISTRATSRHKASVGPLPEYAVLSSLIERNWYRKPQDFISKIHKPRVQKISKPNAVKKSTKVTLVSLSLPLRRLPLTPGRDSFRVLSMKDWPLAFFEALLTFSESEKDLSVAARHIKSQYDLRREGQGKHKAQQHHEGYIAEDVVQALAVWQHDTAMRAEAEQAIQDGSFDEWCCKKGLAHATETQKANEEVLIGETS